MANPFKTGRTRTVTWSGTLGGTEHDYWQGALNSAGTCHGLDLPPLSTSSVFAITIVGPFGNPLNPAEMPSS